ncbi:hypothetical protein RY831_23260 [Noviherbaspirillum sp. CPCC 100848]|uniref:DUF5641 domain-containing protein n=1 Tax=Noviherbaspirillum album TaxID=3080276 RepID=A0ABU6JEJ7_9BURK|nr:hypothetical protein [Noviherbaspirillum sp. CPCC 100848]MEC4722092.1 hypothetical protein [Noviherbaspirillum sp. CPCC 100848]
MDAWNDGDRVIWRLYIAPGKTDHVPCIVREVMLHRVKVEIANIVDGETIRVTRLVAPKNLVSRTQHIPEVDGN